ncbi:hypothetical protein EDB89DRAFT_1909505 [Lactarius sanguifluus]|nr:hypothetical protein EDB89DRAFT_1909505 [Lactarius sanguifluus]
MIPCDWLLVAKGAALIQRAGHVCSNVTQACIESPHEVLSQTKSWAPNSSVLCEIFIRMLNTVLSLIFAKFVAGISDEKGVLAESEFPAGSERTGPVQAAELAGCTSPSKSLSRPEPECAPLVQSIRQKLVVEEGQAPVTGDVAGRRGVPSVIFEDIKAKRFLALISYPLNMNFPNTPPRRYALSLQVGSAPDTSSGEKWPKFCQLDTVLAAQAYSHFALLRILLGGGLDDLYTRHHPHEHHRGIHNPRCGRQDNWESGQPSLPAGDWVRSTLIGTSACGTGSRVAVSLSCLYGLTVPSKAWPGTGAPSPCMTAVLIHIRDDGIGIPIIPIVGGAAAAASVPHTLHTFHLELHVLFSTGLLLSIPVSRLYVGPSSSRDPFTIPSASNPLPASATQHRN